MSGEAPKKHCTEVRDERLRRRDSPGLGKSDEKMMGIEGHLDVTESQ